MKKRNCQTGIEISDADWQRFEKFLPTPEASPDGGQKHTSNRACLEGLLWLLRSGARYQDMPKHFPSGSTCWLRLQFWAQQGALRKLHQQLIRLLDKKGKGTKIMVITDGEGIPLLVAEPESATPAEVKLVESTLLKVRIPRAGRGRPLCY